jgi:hypothetical protein
VVCLADPPAVDPLAGGFYGLPAVRRIVENDNRVFEALAVQLGFEAQGGIECSTRPRWSSADLRLA